MRSLSNELRAQLFGQESGDPFLMLVTMTHESFGSLRFVDDVVPMVSRGDTYEAFPIKIILPADDGESARKVTMTFDNVSLELISEFRQVTTPIGVKVEMVLASDPEFVQISLEDLKIRNITYNRQTISGTLFVDDFLSTSMSSEKYTPTVFPGIF